LEVPEIFIPEITIPEIFIPEIYNPQNVIPEVSGLQIHAPGCTYWHRDIENTGNTQLLLDDPNGVYTVCDSVFPSFYPIDYVPDQLVITEKLPVNSQTPEIPEFKQPEVTIPKDKKEVKLEPCPSKSALRIGSFVNEKRLERIKGYLRESNGDCTTLYEKVDFKDQFIPEISVIISTAIIGLVAASSPLLLNAVKPIVKQAVKKLTKKKDKL